LVKKKRLRGDLGLEALGAEPSENHGDPGKARGVESLNQSIGLGADGLNLILNQQNLGSKRDSIQLPYGLAVRPRTLASSRNVWGVIRFMQFMDMKLRHGWTVSYIEWSSFWKQRAGFSFNAEKEVRDEQCIQRYPL